MFKGIKFLSLKWNWFTTRLDLFFTRSKLWHFTKPLVLTLDIQMFRIKAEKMSRKSLKVFFYYWMQIYSLRKWLNRKVYSTFNEFFKTQIISECSLEFNLWSKNDWVEMGRMERSYLRLSFFFKFCFSKQYLWHVYFMFMNSCFISTFVSSTFLQKT